MIIIIIAIRTPPISAAPCPHCRTNHFSSPPSQFITPLKPPILIFKIYHFIILTHICIYLFLLNIYCLDKYGKEKENNWPQQDSSSFSFGYVSFTPSLLFYLFLIFFINLGFWNFHFLGCADSLVIMFNSCNILWINFWVINVLLFRLKFVGEKF